MKIPIALEVEIPEETYVSLSSFLEEHSQWDFHQVFTVAVSHFLADQKVRTKSQSHPATASLLAELDDYR